MNIAIVSQFYEPVCLGGAEVSVQQIAEGLAAKGHEVHVATTQTGGLSSREIINSVNVHRLSLPNVYTWNPYQQYNTFKKVLWHGVDSWNPFVYTVFRRFLKEYQPDIVHTNAMGGFSASVWQSAKSVNIPIVHTIRDFYVLCVRASMFRDNRSCDEICQGCRLTSIPRRWATRAVNGVIGISQFMLRRHLESGCFEKACVRKVIHNAVADRGNGVPAPRKPGTPLRLGFLGRIHPSKGIEWLLECLSGNSALLNYSLEIAGAGDEKYINFLKARHESEKVRFVGFTEPKELFEKIDLLVMPSLWNEPLGRVIFEAYAYGIPVVATNRGGAPEIIEDGKTGFVFDPNVPESLIRILKAIEGDPQLLNALQGAAFRKADEFSREAIVGKYETVYMEVASR